MIVSITDQLLMVWPTVMPKYSLTSQKPASLTQLPVVTGVVDGVGQDHGDPSRSDSRQIPLEYAHCSYDQAINSPKRDLRVFTPKECATEHIGLDHLSHVITVIADWVADAFAEVGR